MKCRTARSHLQRRLEGTLSVEDDFRLEDHLTGCDRCAREAQTQSALEEAFVSLPEPPVEHVDVERAVRAVRARIEEGAEASRTSADGRPRPYLGLRRVAAAAAVVLFAVGLWRVGLEASTDPSSAPIESGVPRIRARSEMDLNPSG